jgi:hypothetical protein
MNVLRLSAAVSIGLSLAACAVKTDVAAVPSAAGEVMSSKNFNSPVVIDYGFAPADFDVKVTTAGYRGSACSFPLTFSHAVFATLGAVNEQAFRHIASDGTSGAYRIRFVFVSFDPSIRFQKEFLGSTAIASADIALRVSVSDGNGVEIARQIIRGSGQAQEDVGSCTEGDKALAPALQKALRELAEEYADRVVNELHIN